MYVYTQSGDLYTVGFYSPTRKWYTESAWSSKENAARRVRWLNGGSNSDIVFKYNEWEEIDYGKEK